MNRRTGMLTGVLLALSPFLAGQEAQNQPPPRFAEDSLASQQLIAWTWMQTPQPLPPPEKGLPQPDPQADRPANSANSQDRQHPATGQAQSKTFTGRIVKDGEKYVLKAGGATTYQLVEQSSVKQYENRDVKIVGALNTGGNTIRVTKIELLS